MSSQYGERLRQAREAMKITQTEMARRLNVSQQTYSRWERGISEVPVRHAIALQRALGLPPGCLLLDCQDLAEALVWRIEHGLQPEAELRHVVEVLETQYLPVAHRILDGRPVESGLEQDGVDGPVEDHDETASSGEGSG